MAKLTKKQAKILLAVTAVAITGYILGCLTHSEIMHFLGGLLGLK